MEKNSPKITIIIPTYNRAYCVGKAIESVLCQTFTDFELIIIDDGSTDNTADILSAYNDERLRIIRHKTNRGLTAAKNTGLNNIKGEWFTILDSDDEIIPTALETMINVPSEIDKTINAIVCNCIDTRTGAFSGKGLNCDGYADPKTMVKKCSGEYWGLTKTDLLGDDRFIEKLSKVGNYLWYKINERATRYYIHKALRIYHTEGDDRISTATFTRGIQIQAKEHIEIINEYEYWTSLEKYDETRYLRRCLRGVIYLTAINDRTNAEKYNTMLMKVDRHIYYKMISNVVMRAGAPLANGLIRILNSKYFRKFLSPFL